MVSNGAEKGLSLGKVAAFCGVTRKTILRWVQDGMIDSFALPSGHHRVPIVALVDFLKKNNMPVPDELCSNRRKSVLVVDDDAHIRKIIVDLFKPHFEVREAGNGVDACIAMGANPPDLLFLDNRMPFMDGVEVCRQIKKHDRLGKMRIVIVSAHIDSESHATLSTLADKIIRKPFKPTEIVETALQLSNEKN